MSAKGKVSIALLLVAAFAAGIFFTTAGANLFGLADRIGTDSRADDTRLDTDFGAVAELEDAFTQVSEAVNPTVVQIRSEQRVNGNDRFGGGRNPFEGTPFEGTPFEDFFGQGPNSQGPQFREGLGSGVVVRPNGYIVTNNHVVARADELTVVMADGTEHDAEVVGTDRFSDLAVIKIDAEGLTSVSYGNSENVRTGQWVLAFGSPLSRDLENTVTAGIVSAKGRVSDNTTQLNTYAEFIQTDAAINPGNSGGPLVNLRGELIGINSAIYSRTQQYAGIGFAIPVNLVRNVTDQLIDSGAVTRGFLGVQFDTVPVALSEALDVPRGAAQVTRITEDSPAERAGLEAGDIIVAVDGQELRNYNQLRTMIGAKSPGDETELTVVNADGDDRTVNVTLDEQPGDLFAQSGQQPSEEADESEAESLSALGIDVRNLTPQILDQLGLDQDADYEGVIISRISESSDAYRESDLRRGDIVVEVDRQRIRNQEEFMDAYRGVEDGEAFLVRVLRRQGENMTSFATALRKPAS